MSLLESHGRINLIESLRELTSSSSQAAWLEEDPDSEWLFDLAIHTLLDDWGILDRSAELVGDTETHIFHNQQEASMVHDLAVRLDTLVDRLGDVKARNYVESSEWLLVNKLANEALCLLLRNDQA